MHKNIDHYFEASAISSIYIVVEKVSGVPNMASSTSHLLQLLVQNFQPSQSFRKISQTPLIVFASKAALYPGPAMPA
jgi:hypothetical protein